MGIYITENKCNLNTNTSNSMNVNVHEQGIGLDGNIHTIRLTNVLE